jgi:hypothetical protein
MDVRLKASASSPNASGHPKVRTRRRSVSRAIALGRGAAAASLNVCSQVVYGGLLWLEIGRRHARTHQH